MSARLDRLRETLEEPLLVSNGSNIRYLVAFSSSNAALLVEPDGASLFSDFRYAEAGRAVEDAEFVEVKRNLFAAETEPFAKASVLLDGGGILSLQDVVDCPVEQVRVGMRVAAVWVPAEARTTAEMTNRSAGSAEGCIRGFRPTGEPDLPPEEFVDKIV